MLFINFNLISLGMFGHNLFSSWNEFSPFFVGFGGRKTHGECKNASAWLALGLWKISPHFSDSKILIKHEISAHLSPKQAQNEPEIYDEINRKKFFTVFPSAKLLDEKSFLSTFPSSGNSFWLWNMHGVRLSGWLDWLHFHAANYSSAKHFSDMENSSRNNWWLKLFSERKK